jgi:protocatechuate 3,4-dioxygenase alpha subunit
MVEGGPVRVSGTVFDGAGEPVDDALIELWDGRHFGRCPTDGLGRYSFVTVEPHAGFIDVSVFARGLLQRLDTRLYVPGAGDAAALEALGDRGATLIAVPEGDVLRFDIHLQGERETVFFGL